MEFGYQVKVPGLQEQMEKEGRKDEMKITLLEERMTQSLFDRLNPFKSSD